VWARRTALICLLALSIATAETMVSEAAGMRLTAPNDGADWRDRADENGPELYSADLGGPRAGARALRLTPPDELGFVEGRAAQADVLSDYLALVVQESYTEIAEPAGPYYFGDDGPLVLSLEFRSGDRHIREHLIWDPPRLYNLTLWCRQSLARTLSGVLDALLAGFRWS